MSEKSEIKSEKDRTAFSREVGAKAARKLKARRNSTSARRWVSGWIGDIQEVTPGRWRCWWPGSRSAV
jgi:hypothetical protein